MSRVFMLGSVRSSSLFDRALRGLHRLRQGREVWSSHERVHIELRDMSAPDVDELREPLEASLAALPEVAWARVNRELGRVVVALQEPPGSAASSEDPQAVADPQAAQAVIDKLVAEVARIERERGVANQPFSKDHPERYPGDIEPIARSFVELGASGLAAAFSSLRRMAHAKPQRGALDFAALFTAIEGTPQIRRPLERVFTIALTELGFSLTRSFVHALIGSRLGLTGSIVGRGLRLRELWVRRAAWDTWEAELCARPEDHEGEAAIIPPRPIPRPAGPVEEHSGRAVLASLSAFGAGILSTGSMEEAVGAVFAGMPRAALKGRDAFAAELGVRLTRAGLLVMEPQELRHLERIDTVVIDSALMPPGTVGTVLARSAERAGLRLVIAERDPAEGGDQKQGQENAVHEPKDPERNGQRSREVMPGGKWLAKTIRKLQGRGAYVCLIALGSTPGYQAADLAIGLTSAGQTPPWGAHIIGREAPSDTLLVLDAIAAAKAASRHAVQLAIGEIVLALGLASAGMRPRTTRRIIRTASIASLLAMGEGLRQARSVKKRKLEQEDEGRPWHAMDIDAALAELGTRLGGLGAAEARERVRKEEALPARPLVFLRLVAEELMNPMTPILAGGAALSAMIGQPTDGALIVTILGINALFGGVQRYRAERAVAKLDQSEQPPVRVIREDKEIQVRANELVPGDIIRLESGDVVSADCRVIEARSVEVDESSLTGESVPVIKQSEPCDAPAVADRKSMLYDGTHVTAGTATAVVVAAGRDTEARRALAVDERPPQSGVEMRLEKVSATTAPLAAVGGLAVASASLIRRRPLREVVGTAVSLALAAVPEGLPLLTSMAQLAAANRLSHAGVLVRNPRAVEALGRVNVLCADKTGTLTEGRIRLQSVSNGETDAHVDALGDEHRAIVAAALRATPSPANGELAHMTDRAVAEGGRDAGIGSHDELAGWRRLEELPFEPSRGYHAGLAEHDGGKILSVKGAPELMLPRCTSWKIGGELRQIDDAERERLKEKSIELARRGLRVLAVAEREAEREAPIDDERVQGLSFLGFVGLADPVRDTARAAVADLGRAGVEVVMLTGDHPSTAESIAAELGLQNGKRVVSGPELDQLDDDALDALIEHVSVFARVTPLQKVRIVRSFQRLGRVVAMTGDGANDAPAIRLADVGIALGERATQAARQAADMVVTDERIETIVHAVLEGRALWTSVRDAVAILVGGNFGEIAFMVGGGLLHRGSPPLNTRQILLVNLLTDSLPALAIALRSPRHATPEQLLREGPEASLGDRLSRDIAWRGVLTAGAAGMAYVSSLLMGNRGQAGTVALLALTGAQLGQTLAVGGTSKPVWATGLGSLAALLGIVEIPGLSQLFGCTPLGPLGLLQAGFATAAATGASVLAPHVVPRLLHRFGLAAGHEQQGKPEQGMQAQPPLRPAGTRQPQKEPDAPPGVPIQNIDELQRTNQSSPAFQDALR